MHLGSIVRKDLLGNNSYQSSHLVVPASNSCSQTRCPSDKWEILGRENTIVDDLEQWPDDCPLRKSPD